MGVGALSLGCGAIGLADNNAPKEAAAASYTLTAGSTVYAFVPMAWTASSRFLTMKFKGSGTTTSSGTGTRTEGFSSQTDTTVTNQSNSTYGTIYQLKLVSGYNSLYSCVIPATPTGYSSFTWTQMQVLSYPSTSSSKDWSSSNNWDTSTAIATPSGNEFYVYYSAAVGTKGSTAYSSKTFDSANPGVAPLNDWAAYFLKNMDSAEVCTTTKTAAQNDSSAALTIVGGGWKILGNQLTALSVASTFTSATANKDSNVYYERAASLYDYIMWKYGAATSQGAAVLSNFANRTIPSSAPTAANPVQTSDNSSTLVLGGLAAVAVLAAGGYFFVRKKKSA